MKILIFSDLHQFYKENLNIIKEDFNIIVLLGDITSTTVKSIINYFPNKPIYGVLGNHDDERVFPMTNSILKMERELWKEDFLYPIKDIHLKKISIDNLTFAGMQGSVKYKENQISYTQEEAFKLKIPPADILFSHEGGYKYMPKGELYSSHEGFKALSNYIERDQPKYHIFGHHHTDTQFKKYNTMCYCVYGCSMFNSDTGEIKKIF